MFRVILHRNAIKLFGLVGGIAFQTPIYVSFTRNISLKRIEVMARQKRSQATIVSLDELAEILPDESIGENISNDNLTELISDFLRKEKADVRNVFIRKYYFFDSVGDIAKRYDFTEDKVKSMLYHTRKKLKDYLIKEGVVI